MDSRKPLDAGTELVFADKDRGSRSFFVGDVVGYGASCLVYEGYYLNNRGRKKSVRIKECYPVKAKLCRMSDGTLTENEAKNEISKKKNENQNIFSKAKTLFSDSFDICNEIYESEGLTNSTANLIDIYEKNGTLYTVAAYDEGSILVPDDSVPLSDYIHIVKNIAKIINRIHEKGYLYLDIKPENIFVLKEMDGAVRLIDFDSLIPIDPESRMGGYRISYSRGFAALEQRQGRMNDIGRYTDVYGVGAILFYLLFGRTPEATECMTDARYDYTSSRYDPYRYRDSLWKRMTELFHHTLSSYFKDRYEDMTPVIDTLSEIEAEADLTKPFICDTYYPVLDEMIGREEEKKRVKAFLRDGQKKCLLVTGMGGIGKSTLVRSCLSEEKEWLDETVYLYFRRSIMDTICDDSGFTVSTATRDENETLNEYFDRKLDIIKRIIGEKKAVLVLDNFEGEFGDDFLTLLNVGWKVIVISRENIESDEWERIHVEELKERSETRELFKKYVNREMKPDETDDVDRLISDVKGHTLAIELIAKQVRKSLITVKEASDLVTAKGFTLMTPSEVPHSRDGSLRTRHVMDIFQSLFEREKMDGLHRGVLKTISLFSDAGVHTDILRGLLGKKASHVLADLSESGWISMDEELINIHPVIRETIGGWSWDMEECRIGKHVMKVMGRELIAKGAGAHTGAGTSAVAKAELRSSAIFGYAGDVLVNAMNVDRIRKTMAYYDLFCPTVLELPREREDMIVRFVGLFDEAWNYSDPKWLLRVIDYGCYVLYERGDFDIAARALSRTSAYIRGYKDHFLTGMYYNTLSQYYDCVLGGAYEAVTKDEKYLYSQMIKSEDRAIKEMRHALCEEKCECNGSGCCSGGTCNCREIKEQLVDMYITKANFAIRGYPGNRISAKEIRASIGKARDLMKDLSEVRTEHRIAYELAVAWYYTMVEPDAEKTANMLKKIINHENPWQSPMDQIDFCLVPCAEMMYRHGDAEGSKDVLESAIEICEEHEGVAPYERKKDELKDHIVDVEQGA